ALDDPHGLSDELRTELDQVARTLEALYRDAVDIEFTVERGTLYLLQVRAAKRTAEAAVRIALSLIEEGTVEPAEGLRLVQTEQLANALRPVFDPDDAAVATVLAHGVGSSPGTAVGEAILDADRAVARSNQGAAVVLLRPITSPLDIQGMLAADGIVTARGGALSHAAVVSRALDKPCVVGCDTITVNPEGQWFEVAGARHEEGTIISVDGWSGRIYEGAVAHQPSQREAESVGRLLTVADQVSGCEFWFSSWPADPGTYLPAPGGLGPLPLTDLAINAGLLDDLVTEIDRLTDESHQADAAERLADIAMAALAPVLADTAGLDVHVRLPNLGSPRAQRLIGDWMGIAPQLLLPMGMPALHEALISGIAAAAAQHRTGSLTVLLGGVTQTREVEALARLTQRIAGDLSVGAVIGSVAGLESISGITEAGHPVWLSVIDLLRSFHGFPSALSLAEDVLGAYVAAEMMDSNPLTALPPMLSRQLADLLSAEPAARRVGLDQATRISTQIVMELRTAGLAVYSIDPARAGTIRLPLGQAAASADGKDGAADG
ncbi:MAG: PEP-utilizing enzyme, partial [Acidimicrobiia bacterium]|nr:PEP-utilizing enzyme [Acidimicrobiia bacterium]